MLMTLLQISVLQFLHMIFTATSATMGKATCWTDYLSLKISGHEISLSELTFHLPFSHPIHWLNSLLTNIQISHPFHTLSSQNPFVFILALVKFLPGLGPLDWAMKLLPYQHT